MKLFLYVKYNLSLLKQAKDNIRSTYILPVVPVRRYTFSLFSWEVNNRAKCRKEYTYIKKNKFSSSYKLNILPSVIFLKSSLFQSPFLKFVLLFQLFQENNSKVHTFKFSFSGTLSLYYKVVESLSQKKISSVFHELSLFLIWVSDILQNNLLYL